MFIYLPVNFGGIGIVSVSHLGIGSKVSKIWLNETFNMNWALSFNSNVSRYFMTTSHLVDRLQSKFVTPVNINGQIMVEHIVILNQRVHIGHLTTRVGQLSLSSNIKGICFSPFQAYVQLGFVLIFTPCPDGLELIGVVVVFKFGFPFFSLKEKSKEL
jgi:hypothetical protein